MTNPMQGDTELLDRWVRQLRSSSWLAPAVSAGSLPKFPTNTLGTLPAASADLRGRVLMVYGATLVADALYVCVKDAADAYSWVQLPNTAASIQALINATALGGELGGTVAAATVALVHAGSKHAIVSRIADTTEHTTTSTSATDLVDLSGLSIPVTSGLLIKGSVRKTTGHASRCALGLAVNATTVAEAQTAIAPNYVWVSGPGNVAENGNFVIEITPRDANYLNGVSGWYNGPPNVNPTFTYLALAPLPNATVTDIHIRGICDNALNTLAIKNVVVFEVLYS